VRIDEETVREIVRRVRTVADPDRIILFGSAATDSMSADSDIDLLVVEPDPGNARLESVRIRRAVGAIGHPMDVIVISTQHFEETKDVVGGVAFPANKYGKVVYASPG
jgi:predicted nucleotidyltransferase